MSRLFLDSSSNYLQTVSTKLKQRGRGSAEHWADGLGESDGWLTGPLILAQVHFSSSVF